MGPVVVVVSVLQLVLAGARPGEQGPERNEDLLKWIRSLGGYVEGVSLQPIPGMGLGMVAARNLEPDTLVTRTPLSSLINIEHVLNSDPFDRLSQLLPRLSNANLKGLFIAHEKKRRRNKEEKGGMEREEANDGDTGEEGGVGEKLGGSFWQPYLDSLPPLLHTTHFFSEEELEELQASMVKQFAEKQQAAARKAYEEVQGVARELLPELAELTLFDLQWGVSIWSSRAFNVQVRDSEGEWQTASCLVPLADLFNMAVQDRDVDVMCATDNSSTYFECRTIHFIPAGEQLLTEYFTTPETRHNGRLLMHYGFVAPSNPYDSVSIKVPELTHDLSYYNDRLRLSEKLPLMKRPFMQLTHTSFAHPTINNLLQVFRVILGSIPDLEKYLPHSSSSSSSSSSSLPSPFSQTLSPKSEQRVLKKTADYLRSILSTYPTTIQHDSHIVRTKPLSPNSQLALLLRVEEKVILTANIAHLLTTLSQIGQRPGRGRGHPPSTEL